MATASRASAPGSARPAVIRHTGLDDGAGPRRPNATPVARRTAVELGVSLHAVEGTGPGGRITAEDVTRALPAVDGTPTFAGLPLDLPLREAREAFERAYFEHHLARESSISRLAEKSGLERTHLYRKLKQLGLGPTKKDE